jgi:hypothetical protein
LPTRIARALNEAGVLCPSAADPGRNPHRIGSAWTLGTVAAILGNPRYTARQVWNRQLTDSELADPANTSLGHKSGQRWNLPDGWVISARLAHPTLVSEADFIAAQDISAARGPVSHADTEKIHDNRFLRLLRNMLQAGYMQDWVCSATLSGCPQGGVALQILSRIYLHKLDRFVAPMAAWPLNGRAVVVDWGDTGAVPYDPTIYLGSAAHYRCGRPRTRRSSRPSWRGRRVWPRTCPRSRQGRAGW